MRSFLLSPLGIAVVSSLPLIASTAYSASALEEVVVTAQKRAQNIQNVGIAITAFTGKQLDQLGYSSAEQVTAMAPNVTTIQPNGPSSYFVSIRGVAQNDFSGDQQESPVALYVDDSYISAASGAGFQLFDIDRVEVLRGPQGTLFGRNATGGLVHYITRKPTDNFSGYGQLTYGRYNQVRLEGAISGPITDSVSGRLAFVKEKHDPYIKNKLGRDLNNGDNWAIRGHLLFEFGDNVEWLVSVNRGQQKIRSGFWEHTSARSNPMTGLGEPYGGGDLTQLQWHEPDNGVWTGSYNFIGRNELKSWGASSNLKWNVNGLEFVSITNFWHLEKDYIEDSDASPTDFFNFLLQTDMDEYSQEFRLSGETDRLHWVTGAFLLKINGDFANGGETRGYFQALGYPGTGAGGGPLGLYNPFSVETKSYALFGQLEYNLTNELTLIGGLRYTREEKKGRYRSFIAEFGQTNDNVVNWDPLAIGGPLFDFNTGAYSNAELKKNLISAKLELDWQVTDDAMIYSSFNRGIKAGGFNAPLDITDITDGNPATGTPKNMSFDPEKLYAYELGFKSRWFDGLLRVNGAAYYYDYKDYQAFRLTGLTTYVFNTNATVEGAELEAVASPIDGLDIMLGAGYTDDTVDDAYTYPSGQKVDRTAVMTPKWNINGLVRYEFPFFSGKLAVQGDFNYMSKHYFQLKNSPVGTQDGYAIGNARMTYTDSSDTWSIAAFVNNVTDKEYKTMVFDLASPPSQGGFGMAENYYGMPRWWGVTVHYQWGQ